MPDRYEVTVTIGVHQLDQRAMPGFQASDTFTVPVDGFSGLAVLLSQIHDMAEAVKVPGEPQDSGRRPGRG